MKFGRRKTARQTDARRVAFEKMMRFNPLRNLSPDYLRTCHDEFDYGTLRSAARLWDKIEDTDDVLKVVAAKRKKAVSRHGYEIITDDDSPEAQKHAEALKFFYDQCVATQVDDRNVRGGFPMLVRQMMDSVGKKYAVHEIVWIPMDGRLTAEFWFVPLWYFENKSGVLRYLASAAQQDGSDLEPGEWMVTSGDGVMRACAVAYMFKHLPMQDWLIYSENFGRPIPKGKSTGAVDSAEWVAMEEAVAALASCDGVVISQGSEIEALDLQVKGELPYPPLVDRMDRALATLWRGADLGTMAKGNEAVGASVQGDETDLLEDDDADNITDVLNEQVDKFVIKYMFGTDAPKAWIRIKSGISEDTKTDLLVDETLDRMGFETPVVDLQRRYNRPDLQKKGVAALANEAPGTKPELDKTSEELMQNARKLFAEATALDLKPVTDRLAEILDITDDAEFFQTLETFQAEELPKLVETVMSDSAAATALENATSAMMLNAVAVATAQRSEIGDQKSE